MKLDELKASVSDMSTEDLMETFRTIRHSRANPPVRKAQKKATHTKVPTKKQVHATVDGMNAAQLDALIAKLGG